MTNILNTDNIDHTLQPLFFPKEGAVGLARYDVMRYPVFNKSTKTQRGFFWNPEEIHLSQDKMDYKHFEPHEEHIFTATLSYQILLDSVQGRAPSIAFLPFVGAPELEPAIQAWSFFETIHSESYTHIIRNIYNDPDMVFNKILDMPEILERAASVTQYYDDFIEYAWIFKIFGYGRHSVDTTDHEGRDLTGYVYDINEYGLKKRLYKCLISVYILEGIRFYGSFACSFAFGELEKVIGNAKIIGMIARDENQHLALVVHILKLLKKENDPIMLKVIEDCTEEVAKMFDDAVEQERVWVKFLFSQGTIIGLNEEILIEYIEHITNKRMKTIGMKQLYSARDNNPIPWINNWLDSKNKQTANQEIENTSYVISGVINDINETTFAKYKL